MGCLRDPKHEKFAIEYLERSLAGMSRSAAALEAYRSIGFVPQVNNARRLRNRPEIRARIEELAAEASEFANIRIKRVAVEIDRVGRSNFRDFIEPVLDKDGKRIPGAFKLKDLTELPREITAAIKGLSYDSNGLPKLDLHDKSQANFTLLKHLGGLPDEAPGVQVNILNALSIEDQQTLADALAALPGGTGDADIAPASERGAPAAIPETV